MRNCRSGLASFVVPSILTICCIQASAQTRRSRQVYEQAISAIFEEDVDVYRPPTIKVFKVFKSSSPYDDLPDSTYRGRSAGRSERMVWGQIPRSLRDGLHEILSHSVTIPDSVLPPGVHLRNEHDSAGIVLSMSPIAFNSDSTQALVYVGVHCRGLCGGADIVYLRETDAGFAVAATFPLWRR